MHLSLIHPPMFLSLAYAGVNHSHFHILISIYFFLKSTNIYLILSLSPYLTTSPPFPSPRVHWSLLQSPRSPLSEIFLPLHPNLSLLTDNNLWDTLTDNIHHQPFNFKLQTHIPVWRRLHLHNTVHILILQKHCCCCECSRQNKQKTPNKNNLSNKWSHSPNLLSFFDGLRDYFMLLLFFFVITLISEDILLKQLFVKKSTQPCLFKVFFF